MPSSLSTNQFGLCSKDRSGSCKALSYCAIIIVSKSTTVHQPTAENCIEQRKNGNYRSDERTEKTESRSVVNRRMMVYSVGWSCFRLASITLANDVVADDPVKTKAGRKEHREI